MLSRKPLGVTGATMLGIMAVLGANTANAVINLDATDKSSAAVTYAKETIAATVEGNDGATYYRVDGDSNELGHNGYFRPWRSIGHEYDRSFSAS